MTQVTTSFDDSHILSVGRDGALFVYRIRNETVWDEEGNTPATSLVEAAEPPSVISTSIQQERLKSEQDKILQAGERKKEQRRKRVQKLREEVAGIQRRMRKLPEEERLLRFTYLPHKVFTH